MELAVEEMKKSISEPRDDKVSPKVGAVLIKPDGSVETAYRGELRYGDHAEFALLERKNRSEVLDGSILFATLEPCAPGARNKPKLSCAERIVLARIKKVWVGIEDPDPDVDRYGLKYLQDYDIDTEMFDPDLQDVIRKENKKFLKDAVKRAKQAEKEKEKTTLSAKEKVELDANLNDFSENEVNRFIEKAELNVEFRDQEFLKKFKKLGLLEDLDEELKPTGLGLLLFGNEPQLFHQNSLIKATYRDKDGKEQFEDFDGPITTQTKQALKWFKDKIGHDTIRDEAEREKVYDYPPDVIREAITNAVVHRDYDIEGAPIYFEINKDAIVIKSPGEPVPPIKLDQIKRFDAPSLSRNPKIMYIFDQLDLVEQRGKGFTTIKELPEKHDIPLPVITYDEPYIVMKFPRSFEAVKAVTGNEALNELNEEEIEGYEFIRTKGEITKKEYAKHFEYSDRQAERHLKKLTEVNLIERKGAGPSTFYKIIPT